MKKLLLTWFTFSTLASAVYAQQNIYDLNDFKLVYLVPNGLDERFEVNKIIKNKLTNAGIAVATSKIPMLANTNLDTCAVLTCEVGHGNSTLSGFDRDEVYIHFFDCQGHVVYSCSALSGMKVSSKSAYQNACETALQKFDAFKHDYNPISRRRMSFPSSTNVFGIIESDSTALLIASTDNKPMIIGIPERISKYDEDRPLPLQTNANILAKNNTKTVEEEPKRHISIEEYSMSARANRTKTSVLPAVFQENYRSADEILTGKVAVKTEAVAIQAPEKQAIKTPEAIPVTMVEAKEERKNKNLPSIFDQSYTKPDEVINNKEVAMASVKSEIPATLAISKATESVSVSVALPVESLPSPVITTTATAPIVNVAKAVVNKEMTAPYSSVSNSKYGMRVAPVFPGGTKQLFAYLKSKMKYPAGAMADGIEGKVHIGFVIDQSGNITTITIEKSIRDDLDMEAVRIIGQMPPWRPALIQGEPAKAKVIVPIDFSLNTK